MRKIGLFSMLLLATALSFANPPPAETVFQLSAKPLDFNTATLIWTIKPGYFLYQDRIFIEPKENSITRLGEFVLPKATQKTDARGKTYAIYRKQLTFALPILGLEPGESLVSVHYQGCSDAGFCYPPQDVSVKIAINKQLHVDNVTIENLEPIAEPPQKPQPPTVEALFSSNNWVMIILGFFGFGLLLSFTPCVLPMIPVLSGIIVGHGHNLSTRKAFFLSLSYVLSMSLTYSVIGALIAFVGHDLQLTMQSPWAIGLFSAIFILLALSMFDVYQLRLPVSFQAKLANITRHQARGHYLNAAIMGSLSILILSPCVTAPLIGALGYIANQGSVTLGLLSLFFLSLGMGTPLLLIGTSAGKLLPKAGQWMNTVKAFFGVMLLAVAIYLLERLLPSVIIMGLWACLLIYSGIYLGAISIAKNKHEKFSQGTGIILLVYGCLILIGASLGHVNPLQPMMKQVIPIEHRKTSSLTDVEAALDEAKAQGKPIMLDFYADWCASCKVMEKTTLRAPKVVSALNSFVVLTVDLTANDANARALLRHFDLIAPPAFLFFNGKDEVRRLVGEVSATQLLSALNASTH